MNLQTNSAKVDLGKFVIVRPRADGTYRVMFSLPTKLRPSDWSAATPLPLQAPRTGRLDDAEEVERIRADAAQLYEDYVDAKLGLRPARADKHDIAALIRTWQSSQMWKDNKPRTNKGYAYYAGVILRWAELIGNPDPALITVPDIEAFLGVYDDRPTNRYHLRKALRLVMLQAVRLKWRTDNPVDDVRVPMPKTRVKIWEDADVRQMIAAAQAAGDVDLAAILLTEWEIGQRLTDLILFRHGADYAGGTFRFSQSKTDQPVAVPVSRELQGLIAACQRQDSLYLFHDSGTGRPFRDVDRMWHVFANIRPKGCALQMRALRHSAVVQMARAGCEIPEIIAVTGHSIQSAQTILQTYLPRDSTVAANAMRKRGLI